MTSQIHVGTRKGLITIEKAGSEWQIGKTDFLGDNVTMLLHDPRENWVYAALSHGHFGVKLHRSSDGGANWEECAVPVYPEGATVAQMPTADGEQPPPKPASLSEIWSLEPGGPDQTEMLWAGTIPGGLFVSHDRGSSWQLLEGLWNREQRNRWFGGGKDDPGIHSICVDPRDQNRVLVGVSCGGVCVTEDGGTSWKCMADGMRAEYMPPGMANDPDSQDVHRLVQCPADPDQLWVQHHNGIFHSTDGSQSWQECEDVKPSGFGFACVVHPQKPEVAWFVPGVKDECRVPVDQKMVVTRTSDGGQSFEVLSDGLPQQNAYDIVFRHGMDIDASGNLIVMGSSTGSLWISENSGESWQTISNNLPQIYVVRFAVA